MHNDGYDDNGEFDDVRTKAEARVKKREAVRRDLAGFFMIDFFLWGLLIIAEFAHVSPNIVHTLMLILLCISVPVGLFALGRWYAVTHVAPAREQRYHDELRREIAIEMERRNLTEKRKRLALSDDGELAEISDEYADDYDAPQRRKHTRYD